MTNEEKAREIAEKEVHPIIAERCALEMAKYKDKEFKQYLKNRLKEYNDSIHTEIDEYDIGYMDAIKEIIDELFNNE